MARVATTPVSPRKMASNDTQSIQAPPRSPSDVACGGDFTAEAGTGAGAGDAVGTAEEGSLSAARSTGLRLSSDLPPAAADTTSSWMPPADRGAVTKTRTCDSRAWAATVNAAETAALFPAATTLPRPAAARLLRTEFWVSLVLKPTT